MKKVSIRIIGVFVVTALIFSACKKWIDVDININPDAPIDAPMRTILPVIQTDMAFVIVGGNDICRVTAIWLQYMQGIARQSQSTAEYNLREGDVNNQWNNTYSEAMMNLKILMDKAAAHPHYLGIAQVLMANALGITTDLWNDIPYSEAFQGADNLTPKFDTQQEIYQTIYQLLDNAIANLEMTGTFGAVQGDMMYGGDTGKWIKAAQALKARYTLHVCKRNPGAYAEALLILPHAFTSNAENLVYNFGNSSSEANPLWQFMDERGDISMNSFFIGMLASRFDPRLPVYAYPDAGGGYSGNGPGETDPTKSAPGPAVASMNSPVPFITYVECLFIKAECEFMTGAGDAAVRTTLVSALEASLDQYGVSNPGYVAAYDSAIQNVSGPDLYGEVMYQKYFALYYQAEPYNDWRRTGLPIIIPNVPSLQIPRRYPYPTEEITYNPNTPNYGNIWNRVWWDVAP